jgi:hypothetical protein
MNSSPGKSVLAAVALMASLGSFAPAAPTLRFNGSIAGIVRDAGGIPQMGATVLLFNRYERIIQRALTNERGAFGFESLPPDLYSVRVSLSSFMPAMKHQITVQPGMQSLLSVNLATLLSSVELVYAAPGQGALMSDDWKWTLKTATSTRPILRFAQEISVSDPSAPRHGQGPVFTDTRGIFEFSAGESDGASDMADEPDLGTAFALATSVFGRSKLQVSGDIMHTSGSTIPSTGFRTSYSHDTLGPDGSGPEISVTVHQFYLPSRVGGGPGNDSLPALRTISTAVIDRLQITEHARLEYGSSLDSVSFVDHLNYFSPFARLSYELGGKGTVRFAYSSGAPPTELFHQSASGEGDSALHQDLSMLALAPRVSLEGARSEVQRTQSFELGYEKKVGNGAVNLTAYRESVSNGALTIAGATSVLPAGDVLPNLSADSGTFDVGSYQRYGYSACISQVVGDGIEITASSGRGGVLMANPSEAITAQDVRGKIHGGQREWAAMRASGTIPHAGTRITTSYQWMDNNALMPTHFYLTQDMNQETGFNVHIRQPLPGFFGMPGHVEATADLRNMLAQGYLGIPTAGARQILLMQSPRSFRGGLSFIF